MPFLQLVSLTFGRASESPGKFVKTRPSRVSESAPLAEGQECTFLASSQATPLPLSPGRHSAISLFVHSSHSGNAAQPCGMSSPQQLYLHRVKTPMRGRPSLRLLPLLLASSTVREEEVAGVPGDPGGFSFLPPRHQRGVWEHEHQPTLPLFTKAAAALRDARRRSRAGPIQDLE